MRLVLKSAGAAVTVWMLLALPTAPHALCEGEATPSVRYLASESDVIVVGKLSAATNAGDASLRLNVGRVLKGSAVSGADLAVALPTCGSVLDGAGAIGGVWFLHRTDDEHMTFLASPRAQSCPILQSLITEPEGPLPDAWTYDPGLSVEDKLAFELGYSLQYSDNGTLLISLNDDAFHGVSVTTTRRVMALLGPKFTAWNDPLPFRWLIESGDPLATTRLHENWINLQSSLPAFKQTYLLRGLEHISSLSDAEISVLGAIVSDATADRRLRGAAAIPLRDLHSVIALRYLAPLLDNDDLALREQAISAIACYANGVPALDLSKGSRDIDLSHPSQFRNAETMSHFAFGHVTISRREEFYSSFWQSWWQQNSALLLSQ